MLLNLEKFRALENNDFRILSVTESLMNRHEFIPLEEIIEFSEIRKDEVEFRIKDLSKDRFLSKPTKKILRYEGYQLTLYGLDALALNFLVRSGVIDAIGQKLGVGKESDIYEAINSKGTRLAVKFHRLGRTSFRQTLRKRGFVAEQTHMSWLNQSKLSAEKEYSALRDLTYARVSTPKAVKCNRHIVVMSLISGTELKFAEMEDPKPIVKEILRNVRRAYVGAKLIHSDLSEYNILIKPDGKILIIDWPQSVSIDHPNAHDNLKRDVQNIITFFKRKSDLKMDLDNILEYVKGNRRNLSIKDS
jgi:RIO kinase 2